ncbi:MAG: hypothetical protein AAF438_00700 [Pseudomonadota bacterium]
MIQAVKAKVIQGLILFLALIPWIASMFTFYWLDASGTWTSETPHRGKISVVILSAGMALSFALYTKFFIPRKR